MISVEEALAAITDEVRPLAAHSVPLDEAYGLVLAEEIMATVDSPPFDKALMDGFAVRAADLTTGGTELKVVEEVIAGRMPACPVSAGEATHIMTGAPIPAGADTVVRLEETEFDIESRCVRIVAESVSRHANIMDRGTVVRQGARVMSAGRMLRPQELGALAELGVSPVKAYPRPRVAVLATGDELVKVTEKPGPGQIRNSNETMLTAQIRRAGAEPVPLGIVRDEPAHLRKRIDAGLQFDMLLLSGGVSAGKLDLVPSQLRAAGVRQVFHKVRLKPGKPVWFGVLDRTTDKDESASGRCCVFGLPGNPVGSMVCFELFVRTAIRRMMGLPDPGSQTVRAVLGQDHRARGNRPTYHPARLECGENGASVHLVAWQGSADLQATIEADAMAILPAGDKVYPAGTSVEVIDWGC